MVASCSFDEKICKGTFDRTVKSTGWSRVDIPENFSSKMLFSLLALLFALCIYTYCFYESISALGKLRNSLANSQFSTGTYDLCIKLCQLSYAVRSNRLCHISKLSQASSISKYNLKFAHDLHVSWCYLIKK